MSDKMSKPKYILNQIIKMAQTNLEVRKILQKWWEDNCPKPIQNAFKNDNITHENADRIIADCALDQYNYSVNEKDKEEAIKVLRAMTEYLSNRNHNFSDKTTEGN